MPLSAAILGLEGPALSAWEKGFFAEAAPYGFILFARNVDTPEQLRRLTAELRETVGHDAPILIDQEGGRVQRLGPPHWRAWLPPLEQMRRAAPGLAGRAMFLRYRLIAEELRALGIDTNCAPMADVAMADTHPFLLNRCYGDDPMTVTAAARAAAQGLLAGGVLPVLKHIPGHGRGTADSHLELPRVAASLEDLRAVDFAAFQGLADLPMGMTAHIVYPALDPDLPATQSPAVLDVVRREIGFDGLLMTDDLSMQALSGSFAERARLSLAAGCDVVLHCNGRPEEMEAVMAGTGMLEGRALYRAHRAMMMRGAVDPIDTAAAEAELAEILG
ncbi:glycoside hydrolase family 3 N-terminal domain-containing protein [Mangrovicoccus algicola]|uniref:beta-N-acetylhexosaminidase n=1 Tax=Mangrovicoccus algicola TaxID=2771008 RepID=A0A8J6YTV5_9RHOB|nr:glycoside hydrolase family 3 protein [Mangrovicoccus algicola]MBE3637712.1 glycoside hydrolase family 3 protein [Mangrovicoccus algicola]